MKRKGCWHEGQRYISSGSWSALVEFSICARHRRSTVSEWESVSLLVGGTGRFQELLFNAIPLTRAGHGVQAR